MTEWWNELSGANQGFYISAAFFSVIFLWQFIASIIGLSGAEIDAEMHADIDVDSGMDFGDIEAHSLGEAGETVAAFHVFSLRAILAFGMLFSWAAAMYIDTGKGMGVALVLATVWGLAGWLVVSLLIYWLRGMVETGNRNLNTCLGRSGQVYLDIPADGQGEVRVMVSGAIGMLKARTSGEALKAGTPVKVVQVLDPSTILVEAIQSTDKEKETE